MNRRKFIKNSIGATVTGTTMANISPFTMSLLTHDYTPFSEISSPHNVKINLKPIMTNMIHTDVWEGPCRFNVVSVEEEKRRVLDNYNSWCNDVQSNQIGQEEGNVQIMEPELIIFDENFKISTEQFDKIEKDAQLADAFLVSPGGSSIATYDIAEKYRKPIISKIGLNCRTVDISAYTRSQGLEMYVPNNNAEMNQIISALRTRKVLSQTRILYPTDWRWPSVASVTGINEPEKLNDRFGVEIVIIPYEKLSAEVEKMLADKDQRKLAEHMASQLIEGSNRLFLEREYVVRSMEFYNTIVHLMQEHGCNAFTIECFEFCSSRLPERWKITPCMIHTMFKDQGISSACEGDFAALLSMQILMGLSRKSSHMGNMFFRKNGTMEINHAVPGIKMHGQDKAGLSYQLGRFVESGWGTKVVVDFTESVEDRVTVVRMNPTADRLLVLKGKLVNSHGYNEDLLGCSVSAFVVGSESNTATEFMKKQVDYGNHLVWVYGDYTEELEQVCEILNLKIDVVS